MSPQRHRVPGHPISRKLESQSNPSFCESVGPCQPFPHEYRHPLHSQKYTRWNEPSGSDIYCCEYSNEQTPHSILGWLRDTDYDGWPQSGTLNLCARIPGLLAFMETDRYFYAQVVVRSSAEGPFQDRRIHITINADHVNMVKFDNETNPDYRQLESRIIQMVKQQSPRPTIRQDNSSIPRTNTDPSDASPLEADPFASRGQPHPNRRSTEPAENNRNNTVIYNLIGGFPGNDDVRNRNVHMDNWPGRGSPYQSSYIARESEPVFSHGPGTSRRDASQGPNSGDQNPYRQSTLSAKTTEAAIRSDRSPFSRLGLFDTVFIIDDTSSMQGQVDSDDKKDWPLDKWTALEECLQHIVDIATTYDKDGVDVQFLKEKDMAQKNIKDSETIFEMLKSIRPRLESEEHQGTFFHQELIKAIDPVLWKYKAYVDERKRGVPCEHPKPLNLIVITDGDADDQDEVEDYLTSVAKELDRLEAPGRHIGIQFVQIGDDKAAAKWLTDLDDGFKERGIRDVSVLYLVLTKRRSLSVQLS